MKSKMLGALALLTLIGALFVIQSADQNSPTADAAAGSIAALNVGTCLTTDGTVFKGECTTLVNDDEDWEVRDKIAEVPTLYATYAHDPKTQSEAPRAILMDSDLLQISITDTDRDKRTGVLIRGSSFDEGSSTLDDVDGDGTADITIFDSDGDNTADAGFDELIIADLGALDYPKKDASGDLEFSSEDAITDGIDVFVQGSTGSISVIANSGADNTLNFRRQGCVDTGTGTSTGVVACDGAGESHWQFNPGDFKVDDGAVVRFYGCLEDTGGDGDCIDTGETIKKLTELTVDEDASNGEASGNTAPWLAVNASVPNGKQVVIMAVYYRTSNKENLVGGQRYHSCDDAMHSLVDKGGSTSWKCDPDTSVDDDEVVTAKKNSEFDVVYTSNEQDRNQALVVRASADGDLEDRSVNLYLTETNRFNGVYQGFIRLTDANGDGSTTRATGTGADDWGRVVTPGTNDMRDGAAVLAVESGPVTIEYRDTNGTTQRLRIEIDKTPPTVSVTSPAHGSSSGDQTPDFAGTIEDIDSGLVDNSFRLVVDNQVDQRNGENDGFALDGKAPKANEVIGPVSGARLTRIAGVRGVRHTRSDSVRRRVNGE